MFLHCFYNVKPVYHIFDFFQHRCDWEGDDAYLVQILNDTCIPILYDLNYSYPFFDTSLILSREFYGPGSLTLVF